jgi:hypothetical protein
MMGASSFNDDDRRSLVSPEHFASMLVVSQKKDEDTLRDEAERRGLVWEEVKQQVGLHRCEVCGVWLYEEMMCGGVCELHANNLQG